MRPFRTSLLLTACAASLCLTACDLSHVRLRPVQMELYTIYSNSCLTDYPDGFRQVYFDPYLLVVSETNKFSLRDTDIRDIGLSTNDGKFLLSLMLKKRRCGDFRTFTTANSNMYIAVMVNGAVQNISKIRHPVVNGRLQFVSSIAQSGEIARFIRLFVL